MKKNDLLRWGLVLPIAAAAYLVPLFFFSWIFRNAGDDITPFLKFLSGIFGGFAFVRVGANLSPIQNKMPVAKGLIILALVVCVVGSTLGIIKGNWNIIWISIGTVIGTIAAIVPKGSVKKAINYIIKDD